MEHQQPTIHVDYAAAEGPPPWGIQLDFEATNGEPILTYRTFSTTTATHSDGRPIPDGWVLHTNDGDEWIVGAWDIDAEAALAKAREYLAAKTQDEQ